MKGMKKSILIIILLLLNTPAIAQVTVNWDVLGMQDPATDHSIPAAPSQDPAPIEQQSPVIKAAKIRPQSNFLGATWSGRANLGASLQKGNSDTQNIDADAETTAKWGDIYRAKIAAEYAREEENDNKTVDNRSIEGLFDYFFAPKWFANANIKFEQDDIADLDLRSTYGLAIGHQLYDRDDLKLRYQLGPSYLREERGNGNTEDSLAYSWKLDYEQSVWDDAIRLFHNHQLLVPSDETDRYVLETETGARVPLRKSLIATIQIDHDVDKGAPNGSSQEDTKYGVKLGYEW